MAELTPSQETPWRRRLNWLQGEREKVMEAVLVYNGLNSCGCADDRRVTWCLQLQSPLGEHPFCLVTGRGVHDKLVLLQISLKFRAKTK